MKEKKNYLLLILKGCAMGAADVVPGVSGGTIAFITGIYEELLNSIKSINLGALKLLLKFDIKDFWKHINGNFLIGVCSGIAISIISLAKLMTYMLAEYPIFIWSFFLGLIIASSLMVGREIKKWNITTIISMLIGAAIAYYVTVSTPSSTPDSWWFIMVTGAVAICAMILPGISGSFIMLLMGKYLFIMNAISSFDMAVIGLFAVGAAIGIVSFSHVLSWLLKNFHSATISLLTGFMIGSLNKVWPWKEVVSTYTDRHGAVHPLLEKSVMPSTYEAVSGNDSMLLVAIAMVVVGFFLIYGIELLSHKLKR